VSVRLESESLLRPHSVNAYAAIVIGSKRQFRPYVCFAMNNKVSPLFTNTSNKCSCIFPCLERRFAGEQAVSALRFEAVTAEKISIVFYRAVTPCRLAGGYQVSKKRTISYFRAEATRCHN
jgi:hypothetical protein